MSDESQSTGLPESLTFHYIKSPQFREIYVEGAIGSITPRGYISIALYKERPPIPLAVTHKLQDDGTLGEEQFRDSKNGMVRTVETNLYLDKETAVTLTAWLQERIQDLERREEMLQTASQPKEETN